MKSGHWVFLLSILLGYGFPAYGCQTICSISGFQSSCLTSCPQHLLRDGIDVADLDKKKEDVSYLQESTRKQDIKQVIKPDN